MEYANNYQELIEVDIHLALNQGQFQSALFQNVNDFYQLELVLNNLFLDC